MPARNGIELAVLPVISKATKPTTTEVPAKTFAIWEDTANTKWFLIVNNGADTFVIEVAATSVAAGNGLEATGLSLAVKALAAGSANIAAALSVAAGGVGIKVDDSTIEEGASLRLRVKDGGITRAKLADQKAKIVLAGATPVPADFATLTADGHYAFGYGTGGKVYLMAEIDNGALKHWAVELTEITA